MKNSSTPPHSALVGALTLTALSLGFSAPAQGIVVARYDFDPPSSNSVAITGNSLLNTDSSAQTNWTTTALTDNATGNGALGAPNQNGAEAANRALIAGSTGNFLAFSSNRENSTDSNGPNGTVGESTWVTFIVTPNPGFFLNFSGQTATIDTYARNTLAGTSSTNWTLYFSLNGGSSYTTLGTSAGASAGASAGTVGPTGLSWNLASIGSPSGPVTFLLDPVSTGGTNGTVDQRSTGFDNLIVNANVTPVPLESDALPILGSAAFMARGIWWKRRRSQGKVADFVAKQ